MKNKIRMIMVGSLIMMLLGTYISGAVTLSKDDKLIETQESDDEENTGCPCNQEQKFDIDPKIGEDPIWIFLGWFYWPTGPLGWIYYSGGGSGGGSGLPDCPCTGQIHTGNGIGTTLAQACNNARTNANEQCTNGYGFGCCWITTCMAVQNDDGLWMAQVMGRSTSYEDYQAFINGECQ